MLAVGTAAALGFAVWNIHRAIEPPLHAIPKQASLDRVSAEVERSLPLPTGEEAPDSAAPAEPAAPAAPGPKPATPINVAEESLSPEADPFVPLPRPSSTGERFVSTSAQAYSGMQQLPPPAYIPASPTIMRLTTATVAAPPRRPAPPAGPVVSIRPTATHEKTPPAPVLPVVPPMPQSAPATAGSPQAAKPETPPTLVGTLLGDQPSAVFLVEGNLTIVPSGGLVAGWQLLKVDHGQAVLKNLASGLKVPVVAAGEGTASGG
jgi:hypothetical protein